MLERMNIYSPLSGITTNQSEAFNTVLKHYEGWKEAPLDSMILGLYQIQVYYHNEIQRVYSGLGSYLLSPDYSFAAIPLDELVTVSVTSPADIVAKIRSSREFVNGCVNSDADIRDGEQIDAKDTETVSKLNDDRETSGTTTSNSFDNAAEASQYSRARYVIANNYHIL